MLTNIYKMIRKSLISLVTAISILVFSVGTGFALSDISGYPYQDAIEYLEDAGIINGYPDGTFKPYSSINRAELMKILVGGVQGGDFSNLGNCFPDVKNEWFAKYICYAAAEGWVEGYPDGYFRPGDNTNKAEAIKMLINSQQIDLPSTSADVYEDVPRGQWYTPYIQAAKEQGFLVEDGRYFYPGQLLSRGLISENLYRILTGSSSPEIPGNEDESAAPPDDENFPEFVNHSALSIWANEGGDKVTKDETRADDNPQSVINSVWNGEEIKIFAAKNEVVNFNLILESPNQNTSNLTVQFNHLSGPNGQSISSNSGNDLFDWTDRNIELFYVKYLEIKGVSSFLGNQYDQRHLPEDLRAPHDNDGNATGGWNDRPNHNKLYPDIAVPLELEQGFDIPSGENQAIWVDIYVPKDQTAGIYRGALSINGSSGNIASVPVELDVMDFSLPDEPTAKSMLVIGESNLNRRYIGPEYPSDPDLLRQATDIKDKHFLLAHRHKISLIDAGDHHQEDRPQDAWFPRLSGELFTPAYGYSGPGIGIGNNVYSIGTYSSWKWKGQGKEAMQRHANNWETWFENNAPDTERFLYLIDESPDHAQIEEWASWIEQSDGPGSSLSSMATTWFVDAISEMPSLDIVASSIYVGDKAISQAAADYFQDRADKKLYLYNGGRPGQGSFMTDDDGIALRELAWGQFKKNIDRWFYWESTYYNNYQAGLGDTNLFTTAHTFGGAGNFSDSTGESGWNYSNGDGVLFYPGTDLLFPQESYDLDGPIASLRLKFWRRGIQDSDYLKLAMAKDSTATEAIINKIVPKVLWEYDVADPNDPSWVRSEISWSSDPDVWEKARRDLANIILN